MHRLKVCKWVMLAFTICCGEFSCDTANNIEPPDNTFFMKMYGGDGDQRAVDLLLNEDGSVYILGNWSLGQGQGSRVYLLQIDSKGNRIWEKRLGTLQDQAKDIERTNDGNLIILCDHQVTQVNTDIKLIKISVDGSVLDSVAYGSPGVENAKSVTALADDGFIVAGATQYDSSTVIDPTKPNDQSDIFHFRCTEDLSFLSGSWENQYGPGTFDAGTKVFQFSDNRFYVFGSTNLPHAGNSVGNLNLVYYPIDGEGFNGAPNYLGKPENQTESAYVFKVPPALGEGFLILGTETTTSGLVNLYVAKLRYPLLFNSVNDTQFSHGISIPSHRVSGLSATYSLHGSPGYILIGNELRETGRNIWVSKIDQNGHQLWSTSLGSKEDDDEAAAVVETSDGRILVAGTITLINNQSKIVLIKLNSAGRLAD